MDAGSVMGEIRVCPACQGHNSDCPHCGGGGADDARRGLNIVGGVYKPPGSRLTTEEFEKRRVENVISKQRREAELERKEAERQERIRLEAIEAERRKRERLRIETSRRRQRSWFGRIVDGSEPLEKPLNWWEKIIWFLIR